MSESEQDEPLDRTRRGARHGGAFVASCLFHATLIVLAVQLDRTWMHAVPPPVEDTIRVTLVEPPPLGEGGKPKSALTAGMNRVVPPKPKPIAKLSHRPVHDPAEDRPMADNIAIPKPERTDDHLAQKTASGAVSYSNDGRVSSAAASGAGGFASGVPGGMGDSPIDADQAAIPPVPLERVTPIYPMEARVREIEGDVVLEVVIDEKGNMVGPIRVKESIPLLDAAAIAALKQWQFSPARDRDGRPVRVILDVPLHFVLD